MRNRYPAIYELHFVRVFALVALGMLIVSCSPSASQTANQALIEYVRADSLQIQNLRVPIERPIHQGKLLVYTFRADQSGSVWDGIGYAIAEQHLIDGWVISEAGMDLSTKSPSLLAYTSAPINQEDTLIFGRAFAPHITGVKVILNTGAMVQEHVRNGVFAMLVDQRVRIKEVRVLGANDVVIKQYHLPRLLEADDE